MGPAPFGCLEESARNGVRAFLERYVKLVSGEARDIMKAFIEWKRDIISRPSGRIAPESLVGDLVHSCVIFVSLSLHPFLRN